MKAPEPMKDMCRRLEMLDNLHIRRFAKLDRPAERIPVYDLLDILHRQHFRCPYCDIHIGKIFSMDHIEPVIEGGRHEAANIQFTCLHCNKKKYCDQFYRRPELREGYNPALDFIEDP